MLLPHSAVSLILFKIPKCGCTHSAFTQFSKQKKEIWVILNIFKAYCRDKCEFSSHTLLYYHTTSVEINVSDCEFITVCPANYCTIMHSNRTLGNYRPIVLLLLFYPFIIQPFIFFQNILKCGLQYLNAYSFIIVLE